MNRDYVVNPQADGSFLVTETFTNGTFTTVAGNSPQDSAAARRPTTLPPASTER